MKGANIIMIYNENTGRITVFSIKVAHKPYQTQTFIIDLGELFLFIHTQLVS